MTKIDGTTITITKGDSLEVELSLAMSDGTPYVPSELDEIRFALKERYSDEEPLIYKVIPHDTMRLALTSEDTKKLRAKKTPYVYDIQLTAGDVVDTFIYNAEMYVLEEVD